MINKRILVWDGCHNVRDMGGLRTLDGRSTRWKAIVRADSPAKLTEAGWAALYAYGIRTIVTLRTFGMVEDELDFESPYSDIIKIQAPIEDITDQEFLHKWAASELWSTPLYYRDAIQRWPERHASAIRVIAQAQPGGVLFHCKRGVDRTGILALLMLTLVGVQSEDILADYDLSSDPEREKLLEREQSSVREAVLGAVEGLDIEKYLLMGGASQDDLGQLRRRFLE